MIIDDLLAGVEGWATFWLIGMTAIASAVMLIALWPIIHTEARENPRGAWHPSTTFLLTSAWSADGFGAIIFFGSLWLRAAGFTNSLVFFLFWGGLTLWLIAKTIIIRVSGSWGLCMASFAVWTLLCAAWALFLR